MHYICFFMRKKCFILGGKMNKSENSKKIVTMCIIGLMSAIMCIAGPNSIPIGPVPISLTNLVIYIAAYVLTAVPCMISVMVYLLLGIVGLPVFSGYIGGIGKIMGPTGGYLIGFIITGFICSYVIWKFADKIYMHVIGMVVGLLVAYLFGTVWFCVVYKTTFIAALTTCVFPFLLGDAIKIIIAAVAGPVLHKRLKKANLI